MLGDSQQQHGVGWQFGGGLRKDVVTGVDTAASTLYVSIVIVVCRPQITLIKVCGRMSNEIGWVCRRSHNLVLRLVDLWRRKLT